MSEIDYDEISALPIADFQRRVLELTVTELKEYENLPKLLAFPKKFEIYRAIKSEKLRISKGVHDKVARTDLKHGLYTAAQMQGYLYLLIDGKFNNTNLDVMNDAVMVSVIDHVNLRLFGVSQRKLKMVLDVFNHMNGDSVRRKVNHLRKNIFTVLQLNTTKQFLSQNTEQAVLPTKIDLKDDDVKVKVTKELKLLKKLPKILFTADKSFDDVQNELHTWFFENLSVYYTKDNPIVQFWLEKIELHLHRSVTIKTDYLSVFAYK